MNVLLIFFALPIATIIISIALQKILKCPFLVAAIIFAIFIILTFTVFNIYFIIATLIYTILSFITAYITCVVQEYCNRRGNQRNCNIYRRCNNCRNSCNCDNCRNCCNCNNNETSETNELLTINSTYRDSGNLLTISSNNNCTGVGNE